MKWLERYTAHKFLRCGMGGDIAAMIWDNTSQRVEGYLGKQTSSVMGIIDMWVCVCICVCV